MESCREQGQQLIKVWRTGVREDQRLEQQKEEERGPMALEEQLLCPPQTAQTQRQPPRELQAGREADGSLMFLRTLGPVSGEGGVKWPGSETAFKIKLNAISSMKSSLQQGSSASRSWTGGYLLSDQRRHYIRNKVHNKCNVLRVPQRSCSTIYNSQDVEAT